MNTKRYTLYANRFSSGFTAIELLVVVAIIALLAAVGGLIGFDALGRSSVHSERDLLVSLLTSARARALANVNEKGHGIHINLNEFVIFEGTTYNISDPKNRSVGRNTGVTVTTVPANADIIFNQLSASVVIPVGISLTQGGQTDAVDINSQGRVEW